MYFLYRRAQENEQAESDTTPRGPRRRKTGFPLQERNDSNSLKMLPKKDTNDTNHVYEKPVITGGIWTDDDVIELIKLVKKYPGGTPERWEKIADTMNRTVGEVTHMAKKVYTYIVYFIDSPRKKKIRGRLKGIILTLERR